MDAELKAKWLAALRSGTYQQGKGLLKNRTDAGVCFCCLGVLADIASYDGGDGSYLSVCEDEAPALGLSMDLQSRLGSMNDDGLNFHNIATWIEQHIPDDEAPVQTQENVT